MFEIYLIQEVKSFLGCCPSHNERDLKITTLVGFEHRSTNRDVS